MAANTASTTSLHTRLIVASLFILLTGGVLVTAMAWTYGQSAARDAFDRLLLGAADQISASISLSDGDLLVDLPSTAFDLLALSRDDRLVYRVADTTGATLTGFDSVPLVRPSPDPSFYDGDITGEPARFVALARNFAERDFSGSTITIVGHTLNARNALAWDIMQNAWLILLLAGVGMTALALLAIRSALEPLRRIGQHLLERDPEDLSPIDLPIPRELSAFVAAFNRFTGRLDRQVQVMQELIADSAHQLRTPIAALRATTRNSIEDATSDDEKAAFEKIDAQTKRLGRLADQLLSRALVIHRSDAGKLVTLDLREVAIAAVESVDGLLSADDAIRLDLPETPASVMGDALSLREAAKNLISNALDHGAPPFEVKVSLDGDTARLSVRDSGTGMDEIEWRGRARRFGRSQDGARTGGLGLSIVRSVMLAHAGRVEIGRSRTGLFAVTLAFSAASPPRGKRHDG